ncbi:negative regulator of Ofd1, Nro1 [Schizosaccharomyces pombe]|uniref:Negative regulator of ofd1 n=1 Tax=Schizosaccharomyces pombe (strain 972 / ATCC 24843) TaxID=284812 RepID=ETT1_SCHPO|nr:nuclear pore complex-associated protein [Schizosaccharomyces pombe]Q9USJ7.1 RecName: Full=Negative regulator of ofd1 [Schizosaccharomyces pombe 972h-]3MSV_A Chain A, Nuclear import adaptor, Nro1 [Schizosaccharomyces pombe]3MSV_B Chain B, Nuclear import adaptor, Nro1 [Schizosaccharomyces pombe]CAB60681.1 nuclear pore complex associated protein [Schizosaccharomyces pombe]|eukprot:NP_588083.1 nuclear pore complex-associated protein [Schizosaccharomyces pombe]
MIGRRPQGLRAAASLKKQQQLEKQKQEASYELSGNSSPSKENGSENVDNGEMEDETMLVYTEEDNISQLWGLYEMSREKLENDDIDASVSLVFGTIHEADRILRNTEDISTLPKDFHAAYSSALLAVSELFEIAQKRLKETNTEESYIDAAIERAQLGLDAPGNESRLFLALARAYLEKVRVLVWRHDNEESLANIPVTQLVNPYIEKAIQYLRPLAQDSTEYFDALTPDSLRPLYILSSYLFQFGDQFSEAFLLDVCSIITALWLKSVVDPNTPAYYKLIAQEAVLNNYTTFAEYYMDLLDNSESNVDDLINKASSWLNNSVDTWNVIYTLDKSPERLLKLADIKMDLAQIVQDEASQDNYLKEACNAIKEAQGSGVELSPDYVEFVEAYSA